MTAALPIIAPAVESRARLSGGTSGAAIYSLVVRALASRQVGGVLVDVGCGEGDLWAHVSDRFDQYIGIDAVQYAGFPCAGEFHSADLDDCGIPVPDAVADVVAAVETIEHLENPRALVRELVRVAKPGGWVLITTPNQLSLLSKL